jgi:hypothetical protein
MQTALYAPLICLLFTKPCVVCGGADMHLALNVKDPSIDQEIVVNIFRKSELELPKCNKQGDIIRLNRVLVLARLFYSFTHLHVTCSHLCSVLCVSG